MSNSSVSLMQFIQGSFVSAYLTASRKLVLCVETALNKNEDSTICVCFFVFGETLLVMTTCESLFVCTAFCSLIK